MARTTTVQLDSYVHFGPLLPLPDRPERRPGAADLPLHQDVSTAILRQRIEQIGREPSRWQMCWTMLRSLAFHGAGSNARRDKAAPGAAT
jgi:hypothetical protein